MRVMVLGGDGFCGWQTSLYLSDRGHDITIIDNLSRRKIDVELEVEEPATDRVGSAQQPPSLSWSKNPQPKLKSGSVASANPASAVA